MAAWIPDWIWKLLPDSMGGFLSLVWLGLFWILRVIAVRMSDNGSESPYRGMLCSGAAFSGVVALTMGFLLVVALTHLAGFGVLLALVAGPLFLISCVVSHILYQGARDGLAPRAQTSHAGPMPPSVPDRRDAA